MRHAAALQLPLQVLAVHEVPKSYWGGIPVVGPADAALLEQLRSAADQMTQRVADQLGDARPASVSVRAVNGFVVKELVDAARDADMVVLGSRSHHGISRLVTGSVAHEVIEQSVSPVVLVPHVK
jgi:nucleotide-binding universal stress UspA family protein